MRLEIGTKSNETKPKEVILTMSINPAIPVGICLISCALPDMDRVRKSTGQLGHILDALDGPTVLAQDLKVSVVAGGDGQLRAHGDHL